MVTTVTIGRTTLFHDTSKSLNGGSHLSSNLYTHCNTSLQGLVPRLMHFLFPCRYKAIKNWTAGRLGKEVYDNIASAPRSLVYIHLLVYCLQQNILLGKFSNTQCKKCVCVCVCVCVFDCAGQKLQMRSLTAEGNNQYV